MILKHLLALGIVAAVLVAGQDSSGSPPPASGSTISIKSINNRRIQQSALGLITPVVVNVTGSPPSDSSEADVPEVPSGDSESAPADSAASAESPDSALVDPPQDSESASADSDSESDSSTAEVAEKRKRSVKTGQKKLHKRSACSTNATDCKKKGKKAKGAKKGGKGKSKKPKGTAVPTAAADAAATVAGAKKRRKRFDDLAAYVSTENDTESQNESSDYDSDVLAVLQDEYDAEKNESDEITAADKLLVSIYDSNESDSDDADVNTFRIVVANSADSGVSDADDSSDAIDSFEAFGVASADNSENRSWEDDEDAFFPDSDSRSDVDSDSSFDSESDSSFDSDSDSSFDSDFDSGSDSDMDMDSDSSDWSDESESESDSYNNDDFESNSNEYFQPFQPFNSNENSGYAQPERYFVEESGNTYYNEAPSYEQGQNEEYVYQPQPIREYHYQGFEKPAPPPKGNNVHINSVNEVNTNIHAEENNHENIVIQNSTVNINTKVEVADKPSRDSASNEGRPEPGPRQLQSHHRFHHKFSREEIPKPHHEQHHVVTFNADDHQEPRRLSVQEPAGFGMRRMPGFGEGGPEPNINVVVIDHTCDHSEQQKLPVMLGEDGQVLTPPQEPEPSLKDKIIRTLFGSNMVLTFAVSPVILAILGLITLIYASIKVYYALASNKRSATAVDPFAASSLPAKMPLP